jgi:hypothetical protein
MGEARKKNNIEPLALAMHFHQTSEGRGNLNRLYKALESYTAGLKNSFSLTVGSFYDPHSRISVDMNNLRIMEMYMSSLGKHLLDMDEVKKSAQKKKTLLRDELEERLRSIVPLLMDKEKLETTIKNIQRRKPEHYSFISPVLRIRKNGNKVERLYPQLSVTTPVSCPYNGKFNAPIVSTIYYTINDIGDNIYVTPIHFEFASESFLRHHNRVKDFIYSKQRFKGFWKSSRKLVAKMFQENKNS